MRCLTVQSCSDKLCLIEDRAMGNWELEFTGNQQLRSSRDIFNIIMFKTILSKPLRSRLGRCFEGISCLEMLVGCVHNCCVNPNCNNFLRGSLCQDVMFVHLISSIPRLRTGWHDPIGPMGQTHGPRRPGPALPGPMYVGGLLTGASVGSIYGAHSNSQLLGQHCQQPSGSLLWFGVGARKTAGKAR